ncbi:MAG: RDD family protein [Candidatus Symbiothrix sp.]|jgi:uncharacterized RDD family membrane protein YckC|nr:RDD family protein [Candidatus Symbiothrix sp.]
MKQSIITRRLESLIIDIFLLGLIEIFIVILLMINISENFLYIYGLATSIGYSLFFCKDIINGQSIGKRILKLQVVDEKGFPVSLLNIILRNIIALLQPIDALYIINNNGKRLGDIICKTKVISISTDKINYKSNPVEIIICFIIVPVMTVSFFYAIWTIANSI